MVTDHPNDVPIERLRVEITGLVQGVGFRPFVYRLASELGLAGWVLNDTRGVFIEVEGGRDRLERFRRRLEAETPPRAEIQSIESAWLPPAGFSRFEIRMSDEAGAPTAPVLPDIAACADCLAEVLNPSDRRHRYPFTNCTNCGPRFSIIRSLPYDRPRTTMGRFVLCADCRSEYEDPLDRRFHAQPNACPACGPSLALLEPGGEVRARGDEALRAAATALREGLTVAVKGLGGYHLVVDARVEAAVERLRERKPRREKPFALMVRDLAQAATICELPPGAAEILGSPEAPILLLRRRPGVPVADAVAPGNPNLGIMLAATPLHHLLILETGFPVVATSGNLSDEPICTNEAEALSRLGGIADLFLAHNRPIARHVDDSVGWIVSGGMRLLRRARGYAPRAVLVHRPLPAILALGAHLKNTIALSVDRRVFLSQHIGDLETPESMAAFERVIDDFLSLYEAAPVAIAHDLHPDYLSTKWALAAAAGDTDRPDRTAANGPARGAPGSRHPGSAQTDPIHQGRGDTIAGVGNAGEREIISGGQFRGAPLRPEPPCDAGPGAGRHVAAGPDGAAPARTGRASRAGLVLAGARLVPVQHHHAHLAACLAENGTEGEVLGVTWDGTGYGTDGTVWGGEFLLGSAAGFERVAHLRPFRLPGGEAAVREPRRAAMALLFDLEGERGLDRDERAPVRAFAPAERALVAQMLRRGVNSPVTTSAGRLFDAVASLIGIRQTGTFEGQAAMELEWAADAGDEDAYPLPLAPGDRGHKAAASATPGPQGGRAARSKSGDTADGWPSSAAAGGSGRPAEDGSGKPATGGSGLAAGGGPARAVGGEHRSQASPIPFLLDWRPLLEAILEDLRRGAAPGAISARFHNALAAGILAVARKVGVGRIALTGGCFQNRRLTESAERLLEAAGFQVILHRQVPPNDGGISLGQLAVAAAILERH